LKISKAKVISSLRLNASLLNEDFGGVIKKWKSRWRLCSETLSKKRPKSRILGRNRKQENTWYSWDYNIKTRTSYPTYSTNLSREGLLKLKRKVVGIEVTKTRISLGGGKEKKGKRRV